MSITLPTTIIPPSRITPRFIFLYGQPKVGKTTALSQLGAECLLIQTDDGGADYISACKIQVNSYDEFMEVCSEIIKKKRTDGKNPYKYVALDTTTKLEDWCEDDATKQYKNSSMGKKFDGDSVLDLTSTGGFSPGYRWLRISFQVAMNQLMKTADNIIATGHIRDKLIGKKDNAEVSAQDIDLTGQIRRMVCAGANAIGYLYRTATQDGVERLRVNFKTREYINCGSHCKYLAGQDFEFNWDRIYNPTPEELEKYNK